jgi:tight adherence protein C
MVIVLMLGITFCGIAVAFTARGLAGGAIRRRETLAQIASYGFAPAAVAETMPGRPSGLRPALAALAARLGTLALPRWSPARVAEIRALLRAAGLYQTEAETFLGYRLLAGILLPALLLLPALTGGSAGPRSLGLACVVGLMGWVMPSFVLKRRGTHRLEQVDREVPELVDLLVTTVEAGVGFTAALQLIARRVEGPLAQELRIALREQAMGLTVEDALQNMLKRVDTLTVRAFVQAIIQGQLLGVSIGKILRDLAVDMRKRRRNMAEERAQKAPTKILFPLVFLILPALFIIVLGGPILGLAKTFGSIA